MLATDPGIVASVISAGVVVLLALFGIAYRMGILQRTVNDLTEDVRELKGQIRDLSRRGRY